MGAFRVTGVLLLAVTIGCGAEPRTDPPPVPPASTGPGTATVTNVGDSTGTGGTSTGSTGTGTGTGTGTTGASGSGTGTATDASAAGTPAGPVPPASYHLAWSDEFNGTGMDWSKWSLWPYEGSPNRGGDVVSADTLSVQNGVLTVTVFDRNGIHHIGLLSTLGKYEPKYGYVEARIEFNDSPGEWCAFWLQTPTMGQPVDNTAVAGAEIDVVEHRAHDNSSNYIGDSAVVNLNWNAYYGPDKRNFGSQVWAPNGVPLQGNWHTYGLLWTDTSYTWFIDGAQVWHTSQAVSQRTEYLMLTCEVQDWRWAGGVPAGGYGTLQTSTTKMKVDYVRVWQP